MKKFELSEWLANPNRKVVTRDGRPVRIICWDRQCELEYNYPVIALVSVENIEVPVISNKEGRPWNNNEINSLFFADEEEELTEFEKKLQIIISEASRWTSEDGSMSTYCQYGDKEIKKISAQILDLARKEIEKKYRIVDKNNSDWEDAYEQGKQDVLKDLPKWKYCGDNDSGFHIAKDGNGHWILFSAGYRIMLYDVLRLPKEE